MAEPKFDQKKHYVHVAPGATALLQNAYSFDFFAERKREGGKLKEVEYLGKTPPAGYAKPPKDTGRRVFSVGIDLKRKEEEVSADPGFAHAFEIVANNQRIEEIEKSGVLSYGGIVGDISK